MPIRLKIAAVLSSPILYSSGEVSLGVGVDRQAGPGIGGGGDVLGGGGGLVQYYESITTLFIQ